MSPQQIADHIEDAVGDIFLIVIKNRVVVDDPKNWKIDIDGRFTLERHNSGLIEITGGKSVCFCYTAESAIFTIVNMFLIRYYGQWAKNKNLKE